MSLDITVNTGRVCSDLQKYPAGLRSLLCPFMKSWHKLNQDYAAAQGLLAKVIKHRKRHDDYIDILQWLIDSQKGDDFDIPFLTNQILFVAIASTRSTATSVVNILFDLVAFPEYQQSLRQEIETLTGSGDWTFQSLQKLKKLDSFIKESQRLNHHLLRKFNGIVIPLVAQS